MKPAPTYPGVVRNDDVGLSHAADQFQVGFDRLAVVAANQAVVFPPALERAFDEVAGDAEILLIDEELNRRVRMSSAIVLDDCDGTIRRGVVKNQDFKAQSFGLGRCDEHLDRAGDIGFLVVAGNEERNLHHIREQSPLELWRRSGLHAEEPLIGHMAEPAFLWRQP
jgi:hypothetical protein